jgi:hypothetical protein
MTLIFLVVDQWGGVGLKLDPNNQLCLNGYLELQDDVTVLKGSLTAYARLLDIEVHNVLWDYPGFHFAGKPFSIYYKKCIN